MICCLLYTSAETRLLCESLSREYKAAAIPIDCEKLSMGQITDIMEKLLYEFAVTDVYKRQVDRQHGKH